LKLELRVTIALAALLLAVSVLPSFAAVYNPGVSVGQWVKYGNIVGIGSGSESANVTDWMKVEVVAVSGKNVTLHMTGAYKNGTAAPDSTMVINVEAGTMNGSASSWSPLIAANLNEADLIPPLSSNLQINKTEARTYVSASRSCNILNMSMSYPGYSATMIIIWDKASGMMMGVEMTTTITSPTQQIMQVSYNAIDTNIFGASSGSTGNWLMDNIIYIATGIVVVVVVVGLIFAFQRRRPVATQVAATATQQT
jgi:hypothetical protein